MSSPFWCRVIQCRHACLSAGGVSRRAAGYRKVHRDHSEPARHPVRAEPRQADGTAAFVPSETIPTGYLLRVEDCFGRSNYREVFSAETAASLIESWAVSQEDTDSISPHSAVAPCEGGSTANANQPVPEEPTFLAHGFERIAAASDDSAAQTRERAGSACARCVLVAEPGLLIHRRRSIQSSVVT